MGAATSLLPGRTYRVIKPFVDFDQINHLPGEEWIFTGTNFLPYDDGLTLHVLKAGIPVVYRLQWRPEEQGDIIDHFTGYVQLV